MTTTPEQSVTATDKPAGSDRVCMYRELRDGPICGRWADSGHEYCHAHSATDKPASPLPDERERFEAMGYCQHLASILHKAQGVVNNETKREIDVGYECATLRQICDAMRAALAARDAEYGRGLRDGIDAQKRRGNTSGCACVLADDGAKIESYCRLHGAMRDDLSARDAEVARLTEAEQVASRFNADFITEIARLRGLLAEARAAVVDAIGYRELGVTRDSDAEYVDEFIDLRDRIDRELESK